MKFPKLKKRDWPKFVLLAFVLVVLFELSQTWYRLQIARDLSGQIKPYTQSGEDLFFLVLGDSTAVGTGAVSNQLSTVGRLGQDFPNANIENYARNGARLKDIMGQFEQRKRDQYDLILLQIGGNDVVQLTDINQVKSLLEQIFPKLSGTAEQVLVITAGDIGAAPLWPLGVDWFFTNRTLLVRDVFLAQVQPFSDIVYVDLFYHSTSQLFKNDPHVYHAPDKFHPNGAGYGLWYQAISEKINLEK